jgi:uncharacterized protein (TIGR00369 family)
VSHEERLVKIGEPEPGRGVSSYMRLDLRETGEAHITGRARALDHLRAPDGRLRTGALLTLVDSVGGLCGGLAALPDGWVVSTNIAARIVSGVATGPLRMESHVLRTGRNNVVTDVTVYDDGAASTMLVSGVVTSSILVPADGPPQWERPVVMTWGRDAPVTAPPSIPDWLGVRAVDSTRVEIDLAEHLRNPWGILHGGVVAMLVDLAAEHATRSTPSDVVLHFLAPNRVGPVRAAATVLGRRSDGEVVRVDVRDEGADRVTAMAVVTVRA